jgi:hypothetical protein
MKEREQGEGEALNVNMLVNICCFGGWNELCRKCE